MDQVTINCTLNKPHLPVLKTQQLAYVYIQVEAGESIAEIRTPLNIALVLDKSGSMEGAKDQKFAQGGQKCYRYVGPG